MTPKLNRGLWFLWFLIDTEDIKTISEDTTCGMKTGDQEELPSLGEMS